jgi:ubiquinone/menaquinone biosynthesis C-methylase UbiE
MTFTESQRYFLPGMGLHWLLPLYDPLTRLIGLHRTRRTLLEQAAPRPGDRVLDVGCGTGDLAIEIRKCHPEVEVVALDPDPKALAKARRKSELCGVSIQLDRGFADALPYPAGYFDLVFSSYMFHHLGQEEKRGMLRDVARVLRPGGSLLGA